MYISSSGKFAKKLKEDYGMLHAGHITGPLGKIESPFISMVKYYSSTKLERTLQAVRDYQAYVDQKSETKGFLGAVKMSVTKKPKLDRSHPNGDHTMWNFYNEAYGLIKVFGDALTTRV